MSGKCKRYLKFAEAVKLLNEGEVLKGKYFLKKYGLFGSHKEKVVFLFKENGYYVVKYREDRRVRSRRVSGYELRLLCMKKKIKCLEKTKIKPKEVRYELV